VHKRVDGTLKGEYLYNGKGERVKRTVYPAVNPPATFFYVYDLSGQLIGEYDEAGALKGEYVYGPTGRLATLKKWYGNTRWHHNNHLGTPQALSNKDGIVIWQADYTPFGIATINRDPDGDSTEVWNRFRFPGQYWDWETQTHYNYFRQYDPRTGRYSQHDPIGLDGGMNPYGYVGGNSVRSIDPTGLRVYSTSHQFAGTPWGHLAVMMIPDDQSWPSKAKGFICGDANDGLAAGKWYMTLSAGPGSISSQSLYYLVSDKNREEDDPSINELKGVILPSGGNGDRAFIEQLIKLDNGYDDNLPYGTPWSISGYNSNSYVAGLLNAAGASWAQPSGNFPLINNPIPAQYFE